MDDFEHIDHEDQLDYLRAKGFARLIEVLQSEESYTKDGRINKTAVARQLGYKMNQLNRLLADCQELLAKTK